MAGNWAYLIFTTIFVSAHVGLSFQCPDGCECSTSKNLLCFNSNMSSIPTDFSMQEKTVLNMTSNQIHTLGEKVFFQNDLVNVEIMDLSYNLIYDIHPNAFYGLNNLKELYLQGNKLTNIQRETFSSLRQLTVLDLRNNCMNAIDNKTFKSLTFLKDLSLSGLSKFNEEDFVPMKNLTQLHIQIVTIDDDSEVNDFCQDQHSRIMNWSKENNITTYVTCKKILHKISATPRKYLVDFSPNNFNLHDPFDETPSRGEFIITLVITIGVLILLIISIIILFVVVRQTERMSQEIDDYSYMNDFEPYMGHLSPKKSKEFNWPTSRDNIPKLTQENSTTPREVILSTDVPESVKVPIDHQDNFKNSS